MVSPPFGSPVSRGTETPRGRGIIPNKEATFATTGANTPDKKATFATTGENTPDKKVTFAPNGENAPN